MKLYKAFEYMLRLMEEEWEFPDASAKAATRYGVKVDALTELYDKVGL